MVLPYHVYLVSENFPRGYVNCHSLISRSFCACQWFNHETPETFELPQPYDEVKGDNITLLILLKAMRPDRIPSAMTRYVSKKLGSFYVESKEFSLDTVLQHTSAATPIFFLLFPGVDPTSWVEDSARKRDYSIANGKLVNLSMGQGQEDGARSNLAHLAKEGGWLMLQNIHLMQNWLPKLELLVSLLHYFFFFLFPTGHRFSSSSPSNACANIPEIRRPQLYKQNIYSFVFLFFVVAI